MKLYIVGSSPQANIRLASEYVSSYHAEILMLDNGDIILTDKSKNGTFVNGNRVQAGKDVSINRGDIVKFADVQLDWSSIPVYKLAGDVREIRGIGTNDLNKIILTGHFASRFHATLKRKTDGKWYLEDHSKNGTSVNGTKITPNTDILLKKSDVITCAGENIANPYSDKMGRGGDGDKRPKRGLYYSLCSILLILLIAGGAGLYIKFHIWQPKEINQKYCSSVCMILAEYKVTLSLDGMEKSISGSGEATGFFVSKDGMVVTNHHVTAPWDNPEIAEEIQCIKQQLINYRNTKNNLTTISEAEYSDYISVQDFSELTEEKELVLCVIPNGKIYNIANAIEGTNIKSSSSMDVDLGYFQLVTGKLPEGSSFIPEKKISKKSSLKVGENIIAIGFPQGSSYQKDLINKEIQTMTTSGTVTRVEDEITFNFDTAITNGSSGSPMFNSHGELVGIASNGYDFKGGNFNGGVHAYLIEKLINKNVDL